MAHYFTLFARSSTTLLLTGLLLGCSSKKDDPAPLPIPTLAAGTGKLTVDGQLYTGGALGSASERCDANRNPINVWLG